MAYVRPYTRWLLIALGAVLVFTGAQLLIPLIIRHAIDEAILADGGDVVHLQLTAAVFGVVILVSYAANYLQDRLVGHIGERVIFDLRRAMFAHLQEVSLSFMDKTEVGRMMSRLQGDVNSLQEFLENSVTAFGDLLLLVGIVVIMLTLNLELGLLTLVLVPTLAVVRIVWLPRAKIAFRRARETNSIANGALAEAIHAVRTVQGMRREDVNFLLYGDKAGENLDAHLRAARYAQAMVPVVDTLTGAALAIVVVLGGSLVLDSALEIGVMVAFLFYVQRFFDPIRSLTIQYSIMQRAMASGQRIFEVLDVALAITDKPDALFPKRVRGAIDFDCVTFGYAPGQKVLHEVSFSVAPGETVALVGPTGSGKTSMIALLHRFYDVWDGRISIDGHDVREYAKAALGRHIAMVLQDPYLFTGTVLDNIRFSTDKATREDIERAARAVGAHDFIVQLADGYDTVLDQQGRNLSLGPAAVAELRPRAGRRHADPDPRRSDREYRFLHRAPDPDRARTPAGGAHRHRDRPPPRHRARRRPHRRPQRGPHRRDRQPRGADRGPGPLCQAVRVQLRLVRRHPRRSRRPGVGHAGAHLIR